MQHIAVRISVAIATFLIGLVTASIPAGLPLSAGPSGPAEREILNVESEYLDAHMSRDVATLDRVLADDFTLGPVGGKYTDKFERLELLENPTFTFVSIDTDRVRVRVDGERAVVTGQAVLRGRYRGRHFTSPRYGYTRHFEKREGRWQIVRVTITSPSWR